MHHPLHERCDGETPAAADARITQALVRLETTLDSKPSFGRSTARSASETSVGVRCRTDEDDHQVETDLPAALGGTATAPTPSVLLRAALGSCLAIGYRLRAARLGVALGGIRVTVETDSVLVGMLIPGSATSPGFTEIRYHVEIETDATLGEMEHLTAEADRLSPVLHALRANRVCRSLSITGLQR